MSKRERPRTFTGQFIGDHYYQPVVVRRGRTETEADHGVHHQRCGGGRRIVKKRIGNT